jgi:hemerythrin
MAIEWTPDLTVGIGEIDSQHQEIFRRINALLLAMREGRGVDEVEETLSFLSDYVTSHFRAEEKVMSLHGYPHLGAHKGQHGAFITDILSIRDEHRTLGPSTQLVLGLQGRLCDWLKHHNLHTDLALATWLQNRR